MAKKETSSTASKPKTQKKTAKDPGAPKRALSAYMFFSQDQREKTKAENPEASFGELGRILGATWKEMSDDEKKPYVDMAERDKERAATAKAEYEANGGGSATASGSKKKSSKKEADDSD